MHIHIYNKNEYLLFAYNVRHYFEFFTYVNSLSPCNNSMKSLLLLHKFINFIGEETEMPGKSQESCAWLYKVSECWSGDSNPTSLALEITL